MISGELRSLVDDIWLENFSGCMSDTLILIEQITYLLFVKRLDETHIRRERR